MPSNRLRFSFCALVPTILCVASTTLAETTPAPASDCVQSFENAQRQRKEGKLKASVESLIACSQPNCPAFISKECTSIYSEVQSSLPSITVRATDGQGQLLTEVDVFVDGELLTKKLDGRAVPIDPGVHEVRFETAGKAPISQKVLVAEGEKNKLVSVEYPAPKPTTPEPTAASPTAPIAPVATPQPVEKSGPPIAAYVVGGLGIAAVGAGVILRVVADGEYDDLKGSCSPNCTSDDTDPVDMKYNLSIASFAVGGAAIATSAVLFILHAGSEKSAPTAGLSVGPVAIGQGALATWSGAF